MTTVAMPVFSTKNETVCGFAINADGLRRTHTPHYIWNASLKVLGFFWPLLNLFMQKNQGILLGVVGTDIPLPELMKLIPKHMVQSAALRCPNTCINHYFL